MSPVLYFIIVVLVVNINYFSYRDILWINCVYNDYTFN